MAPDGTGLARLTITIAFGKDEPSWSPGGLRTNPQDQSSG